MTIPILIASYYLQTTHEYSPSHTRGSPRWKRYPSAFSQTWHLRKSNNQTQQGQNPPSPEHDLLYSSRSFECCSSQTTLQTRQNGRAVGQPQLIHRRPAGFTSFNGMKMIILFIFCPFSNLKFFYISNTHIINAFWTIFYILSLSCVPTSDKHKRSPPFLRA